jgi:hypothetical protein
VPDAPVSARPVELVETSKGAVEVLEQCTIRV